jgi:hypothetical protein
MPQTVSLQLCEWHAVQAIKRRFFEDIGGEAMALDDDIYSEEEVKRIHSNNKSIPRLEKNFDSKRVADTQYHLARYFNSQSPFIAKLRTTREERLLKELSRSLTIWNARRKRRIISQKDLPENWAEFFKIST